MIRLTRRHALGYGAAGVAALGMPSIARAQTQVVRIGLPTKTYYPTIIAETALRQKLFDKEGVKAELTIYRGGAEGYAPDLIRIVNELLRIQRVGSELLGKATGRSAEQIEEDFSRDRFMTPEQAKEYGFIDEILDQSAGAGGL